MKSIKLRLTRAGTLVTAFAFLAAVLAPTLVTNSAYAGQFSPRKMTLSSSAKGTISTDANGTAVAPGAGGNGAQANHEFEFTLSTGSGNIGSVLLQYCTTPLLDTTCISPTGMSAASIVSVASQSGFDANDFAVDTTTTANTGAYFTTTPCSGSGTYRQNCVLLNRAPSAQTSAAAVSLSFGQGGGTDWIQNPTAAGNYYVRVYTFSDNTYTTKVDEGAVAFAITEQIDITAKVQEKLNFSVAAAKSAPNVGCDPLTGTGSILLGDTSGILDMDTAYDQHSYFRLSTNAAGGTSVLYSGDTLKSTTGFSIAPVATTKTGSEPGTAQFGLAIDTSDTTGGGYSFTNLAAATEYNGGAGTINPIGGTARFAFDTTSMATPVELASVSNSTVSCDTGSVRYIGNIGTTTRAGVYRTTITYIAVPTF